MPINRGIAQPVVAALKTCGESWVQIVDKSVDKLRKSAGITAAPTLRAILGHAL